MLEPAADECLVRSAPTTAANYGIFYGGGRRTGIPAIRWIGLAGDTEAKYAKRDFTSMMAHHLNVGIAGYCGVSDSRLDLLYDTFASEAEDPEAHIAGLRERARAIATSLKEAISATGADPRPSEITGLGTPLTPASTRSRHDPGKAVATTRRYR